MYKYYQKTADSDLKVCALLSRYYFPSQSHTTMAARYRPSDYNGLPDLNKAGDMFDSKDGEAFVANQFRNLFLLHNVDRVFGLTLLHRHFDIDPEERLTEYPGTSVPWLENSGDLDPRIQPSNWLLSGDGSFRPYEFHFAEDDQSDDEADIPANPQYGAFIDSFQKLLYQEGLVNVFGLTRYPVMTSQEV